MDSPVREISAHFVQVAVLVVGTWGLKKLLSKTGRKQGNPAFSDSTAYMPLCQCNVCIVNRLVVSVHSLTSNFLLKSHPMNAFNPASKVKARNPL